MSHLVAPSLLAANFLRLADEVEMVNNSVADWFHVDVMDGHFVPNISFGFSIIKQIKTIARKPLDVHLMMNNPEKYLAEFKNCGADHITVHYETCMHLHSTIEAIRELGLKPGVVVNPHTSVELLADIIAEVDIVLIMSVNPGFGGQKFIPTTYKRLSRVKEMIIQKNSPALLEVDGGVEPGNAAQLLRAGADVLVAGSAVFGAENPVGVIKQLKQINLNLLC